MGVFDRFGNLLLLLGVDVGDLASLDLVVVGDELA